MFKSRYAQLILYKTYADLRAESERTYMGYFWWIAEPILYMLVFYIVFGKVLGFREAGDIPFLLIGLIAWKWFEGCIKHGANSLLANGGLMRQVYLPKYIFPSTMILADSFKFLVSFALLMVFLWFTGHPPTASYLAIPILLGCQLFLIVGLVYPIAAFMPFLPDFYLLVENGMRMLFFASGIFYSFAERDFSPKIRAALEINPLIGLFEGYRGALLQNQWPDPSVIARVLIPGAVGMALGAYLIIRHDRTYPRIILR